MTLRAINGGYQEFKLRSFGAEGLGFGAKGLRASGLGI